MLLNQFIFATNRVSYFGIRKPINLCINEKNQNKIIKKWWYESTLPLFIDEEEDLCVLYNANQNNLINWKVKSQFLFKSPVAIELLFGAAEMELTAESIIVVNMIFKYIWNGTKLHTQRIIFCLKNSFVVFSSSVTNTWHTKADDIRTGWTSYWLCNINVSGVECLFLVRTRFDIILCDIIWYISGLISSWCSSHLICSLLITVGQSKNINSNNQV